MFNDRAAQIEFTGYVPDKEADELFIITEPHRGYYVAVTDDYDGPGSPVGTGTSVEEAKENLRYELGVDVKDITYRPSLSNHLIHTLIIFVCGAVFMAAILANKEDVDTVWNYLPATTQEAK